MAGFEFGEAFSVPEKSNVVSVSAAAVVLKAARPSKVAIVTAVRRRRHPVPVDPGSEAFMAATSR